jgi:hypothetical protein
MKHTVLNLELIGTSSGAPSAHPVLPYDGIHGRFVGDGHRANRTGACLVCHQASGNYHTDGCPESYRDLNAERSFDDFSLGELLIIEELSGVPFRGTGWGGFGDPVTDEEVRASARSPDRNRYMPPATHTLQEAIELVKRHFAVDAKEQSPADVRSWARRHGYQVWGRGRLPADVVAAYHRRGVT